MRAFLFLGFLSFVGCAQRFEEFDQRLSNMERKSNLMDVRSGEAAASRDVVETPRNADVRAQVMAMRNELSLMSGRMEAAEFEIKSIHQKLDDLEKKLAAKDREISSLKETAINASGSGQLEEDYNLALTAHQNGQYEKAEALFNSFLIKYPKSALSDNALYWAGEGLMARKQFKKAITRFQDLIDKFPKSDKRCDAMGLQIKALQELGMKKEADAFAQVRTQECPKER